MTKKSLTSKKQSTPKKSSSGKKTQSTKRAKDKLSRVAKNIMKTTVRKDGNVSKSKIIEGKSRNRLRDQLSPWVCTGTGGESPDIGHDFYVEIVTETNFEVFDGDGRHFLLQLKAQSKLPNNNGFVTPKSVETKKIKQWYQNSQQLPYLFVVNDYPSKKFYFQWIDGAFITKLEKEYPYWTTEKYVTFKIPSENLLNADTMNTIREYVLNKKVQFGKLIEPGIYFELKRKTEGLIEKYNQLTGPLKFQSVDATIADLKKKAENATYRLAAAGLSRVGKSTLVNTILKRKDASPVDVNQTTGVPIQFHPSINESVTIHYMDGRQPETFPYSEQIIKNYAAREYNEDNHKKVSFVLVHLTSSQLEKGVMLYDIPGLNDPNPQILNYAYHTATSANAIIYVIDGSSASSGGFVFDDRYRTHIETFSERDQVFLVINKVDKLKRERLLNLKSEINRNLIKYDLKDKINEKIYYLSIDFEEEDRKNLETLVGEYHPFEELENDLWRFILNGDRVGLFKLYTILGYVNESMQDLVEILHITHLNSHTKKKLEEAISSTRSKIPRLGEHIKNQHYKIVKNLRLNIDVRREASLKNLEASLRNIPIAQDLPSDEAIKDYAIKESYRIMGLTEDDFTLEINHLKNFIDSWMQDNLKAVKELLNRDNPNIEYDPSVFGEVTMPKIDFSTTWGLGIIGFVIGAFLAPEIGLLLGIGSAIMNLIFGKEYRRDKKIRGIMKQIDKVYARFYNDVKFKLDSIVRDELNSMAPSVNRKLNLYFTDITTEINKLNLPDGVDYIALYQTANVRLKELRAEHAKLCAEIHPYLASIDPK